MVSNAVKKIKKLKKKLEETGVTLNPKIYEARTMETEDITNRDKGIMNGDFILTLSRMKNKTYKAINGAIDK